MMAWTLPRTPSRRRGRCPGRDGPWTPPGRQSGTVYRRCINGLSESVHATRREAYAYVCARDAQGSFSFQVDI